MSESLVDIDPEALDPFRSGTLLSCLAVGTSYLLPWATVDGPGGEIGDSGGLINVSTTVQGSISPREIALFPELVVGVAVAAALIAWAVVDADGQSEIVEIVRRVNGTRRETTKLSLFDYSKSASLSSTNAAIPSR